MSTSAVSVSVPRFRLSFRVRVCLFALLCCLSSCLVCVHVDAASFVDILAPSILKKSNIDHRPSIFGNPKYGGFITGTLYYPQDPANQLACGAIDLSKEPLRPQTENSLIWVVRRSGPDDVKCHFITKVRNAAAVGAVAVVVQNVDDSFLPYMKGDDSDDSRVPPAVIVKKSVAASWNSTMYPDPAPGKPQKFVKVSMQIRWVIPQTDGKVEWALWTTSFEPTSVGLKSVFGEACMNMENTDFDVHYFILNNDEMDECDTDPDNPGNEPCPELCLYDKYCAHDPDGENTGVSGSDLVRENLFQACLWKTLKETQGTQEKLVARSKWWTYVSGFQSECIAKNKFSSTDCRDKIFNGLSLSVPEVSSVRACQSACDATLCPILDAELNARQLKDGDSQVPIFYSPTILVNKEPLRGGVSCSRPIQTTSCKVLADICMGFNSPPEGMCVPTDSGCDFYKSRDCAGTCHGALSPRRSFPDACGVCMPGNATNPAWNKSCLDCAGTILGNNTLDQCGICLPKLNDTRDSTCKDCDGVIFGKNLKCRQTVVEQPSSSTSWGGIIAIVLAVSGVVGALIYLYMRRQQNRMRDDIDGILKQYLPLDGSGGGGGGGAGNIRPNQRLNGDDNL